MHPSEDFSVPFEEGDIKRCLSSLDLGKLIPNMAGAIWCALTEKEIDIINERPPSVLGYIISII